MVGFADDYVKGALLVEVIDARKFKPIWRGLCNANVTLNDVAEKEKDERVNYAVKELLRTFPRKGQESTTSRKKLTSYTDLPLRIRH